MEILVTIDGTTILKTASGCVIIKIAADNDTMITRSLGKFFYMLVTDWMSKSNPSKSSSRTRVMDIFKINAFE